MGKLLFKNVDESQRVSRYGYTDLLINQVRGVRGVNGLTIIQQIPESVVAGRTARLTPPIGDWEIDTFDQYDQAEIAERVKRVFDTWGATYDHPTPRGDA